MLLLGVFVVMLTLAVTLVASRDARAASLTLDDVDAGWSNAVGASPTITTNTDFTVARWGTEDDNSCVSASALATHFLGGSSDDRSGYIFDSDDTGRTFNDGEVISLGAFTHVNCPITGSSIDSIDLGLTLDFSAPASESLTLPFTFSHWETPNNPQSGTCANGGANNSGVNANGCADRVQVSGTPSDEFKVGDDLYKLQFVGFANSSDAYATACPTPGSTSPSLEFWTVEGQLNFACLYAKIIYSPAGHRGHQDPRRRDRACRHRRGIHHPGEEQR
ncbi:MAG: THxN family PEP-CTERM protein [Dehalococcoidia bacterium]|nr:THxN family PEP-CTERM protein [Dehalococcoidia bacterium]